MTRTRLISFPLAAALAAVTGTFAHAGIVSLTPTDIHGDDTTTASFSDGALTITPFVHDGTGFAQDTFNGNPARLGIDNNPLGTNNNGITDGDVIVGNAGDEALEFDFAAGFGLSRLSYDFSRADGPGANDGVVFSGFTANPVVEFSVADANLFAVWNGVDAVRVNIPGSLFGGAVVDINFTNPAASDGQTIFMTANDTTQAGAQLAIRSIAYSSIPEPSSLALAGVLLGFAVRSRR